MIGRGKYIEGHSGCDISFISKNGISFVRKKTVDKKYVHRLKNQATKQKKYFTLLKNKAKIPNIFRELEGENVFFLKWNIFLI